MNLVSELSYFQKDVIDYSDYVFPIPSHESRIKYYLTVFSKKLMTYSDVQLIEESEYFTKEMKISFDGYKTTQSELIDTEESRRAYFLKSRQRAVRTFF